VHFTDAKTRKPKHRINVAGDAWAIADVTGARDKNFCDFILLLGITAVKLISGGDHMATAKKAAKKSTKKASAKKGKKK
jgi:hypothetical protein